MGPWSDNLKSFSSSRHLLDFQNLQYLQKGMIAMLVYIAMTLIIQSLSFLKIHIKSVFKLIKMWKIYHLHTL